MQIKVFNFMDHGPVTVDSRTCTLRRVATRHDPPDHMLTQTSRDLDMRTNVNLKRKLNFVTSFLKFTFKFIFVEGSSHSSSHFWFR